MIELRTLGGLSVTCDGAPGTGAAAQRKTLALLALLAAAGDKGISRDKLIAFLWSESDADHGRNLLNQACYALRRDLHAHELFLGATELRLNPAVLSNDLQLFEGAIARADLGGAVAAYAGPFLDGFYLDATPEFERWAEGERGRLVHVVGNALATLATDAASRGEHRVAADWWRRLAALDPLSSRAACGVMTALAALGEVPTALQHGRAYETLVRTELGSAPEPGVTQLIGRLRLEPAAGEGMTAEELRRAAASLGQRRTVGYERERAALREALQSAVGGRGLVACVAGEPGSGKTTLVEDFLGELAADGRPCHVARGRCSERLAGSGAYLPLLDALEGLLRGDTRGTVTHLMKQLAPNWYAQVSPSLVADASSPQVSAVQAASQERLKRELNAFLREVCRLRPLIMFLDDVHWGDASTIDILGYVANQMGTAQMVIVTTYRPAELQLAKHPFGPLKLDLQTRGLCREVPLHLLTGEDVDHFLALEFPEHRFPAAFATYVHAKTEGSPLFMVDLLRYLRAKNVVVSGDEGWTLAGSVPDLELELPESVRSMIERKIEQLAEDDRRLLVVAGVQGYECDSPIVAKVLGADQAEVEERLDRLGRVHGFVQRLREHELPDATPAVRYRFVHVLYQNALEARLAPTRRAALSRAVAEALLGHYGDRAAEVAAELAFLFEAARDVARAVEYYALAADRAAGVFAHLEAVELAQRGLRLVSSLPDTPERAGRELGLQLRLGYALMLTKGYSHLEAGACMTRALQICRQFGNSAQLFPAVAGVWVYYLVSAEMRAAREVAKELLRMAENSQDRSLLCQAHISMGASLHHTAELQASDDHFVRGLALYDRRRHRECVALYGWDWGVYARGEWLRVLWLLGYPERALHGLRDAVALAQEFPDKTDLKWPLLFGALLHQHRGERERCLELAEQTIAHAEEHGLDAHTRWGMLLRGWAIAEFGEVEQGIVQMEESLAAHRTIRQLVIMPYWLALLAEQLGKSGQVDKGLAVVEEGLQVVRETFQPFYEAELHRLKGELLLQQGLASADVTAEFQEALDIARRQQARSLELRAAMSLSRLWQRDGKKDEGRDLLAPVYGWFTEGFDTRDLQGAKALLEQLA